jgi:hypothetical protein
MSKAIWNLLAMAVIASVVIFSSVVTLAQATVERTPIAGSVFATVPDFCLGETFSGLVTFEGQLITVTDPSGGLTRNLHLVYVHGRVFGDETGTLMQGTQAEHTVSHTSGLNSEFTETITLNFSGVQRGSADNMLVRALLRITVTANGDVSTEFGGFEATCRA